MDARALSPASRADALARIAREPELDVLVVGGGVVGAGVALDAVTRGLRVALVEAQDWASGTSSRSSKLIHGGLRYLEMLDFRLVREALHERGLLLERLAPHLVRPVPFLYPLTHRVWERLYLAAGLTFYDAMGRAAHTNTGLPRHRHLSRRRTRDIAPSLQPSALVGAVQYWDAQVDDARFTLLLVRTAATYGAHCANRVAVVDVLERDERVIGARVVDVETGREIDVRAKQVVNATGVWSNELPGSSGVPIDLRVRASKGVHLVVPRDRLRSSSGIVVRTETSVLFVIPWGRHWIVGTTDTDWLLDKSRPVANRRDIEYVLDHVNRVLVDPLTTDDVVGVYAGLRPLLAGESDETSKLSREHVVRRPRPGLVVIAGGKFTTYRVMARDAVDAVVEALDRPVAGSCTERVALVGADGIDALWNQRQDLARDAGLDVEQIERLLHRYGSLTSEVLALIRDDPTLRERLEGGEDHLRAEVVYAVTHEGARHLGDVLARRTRLTIETRDRGTIAANDVAQLMAAPLRWGAERVSREVATHRALVAAEREAERRLNDRSAMEALLGVPDPVPFSRVDE